MTGYGAEPGAQGVGLVPKRLSFQTNVYAWRRPIVQTCAGRSSSFGDGSAWLCFSGLGQPHCQDRFFAYLPARPPHANTGTIIPERVYGRPRRWWL